MAFWQSFGAMVPSGQDTDYTPAGYTAVDASAGIGRARSFSSLTTGQFSGTTTVTVNSNDSVHPNACVRDNNFGLIWTAYRAKSVFGTGAQDLLWDDTGGSGEDIFAYCDQANTVGLGGITTWRIPTVLEFMTIYQCEAGGTYLPANFETEIQSTGIFWTSNTRPAGTTDAFAVPLGDGRILGYAKTTQRLKLILVTS